MEATELVSSVLEQTLPQKVKDPGSFNINILLGDNISVNAMLDLGASINLMPLSIYRKLGLNTPLKASRMSIQLADGTVKYPKGILEDLLVQVDKVIVPCDFVIMEMNAELSKTCESTILLGRPFMATTRTIIDVSSGKLSMTVLGEKIQFEVFHESNVHKDKIDECLLIDEFYGCMEECLLEMLAKTETDIHAFDDDDSDNVSESWFDSLLDDNHDDLNYATDISNENVFEIELTGSDMHKDATAEAQGGEAELSAENGSKDIAAGEYREDQQDIELKDLPKHLKYAFLGEKVREKPVVIASDLLPEQEDQLVKLLQKHQKAIGWSLHDIVGISPAMCMHRIDLEEGAKPVREAQRRLNPSMQAVVKEEVLKLLKEGIIYPVPTSQWVSPVHVVPKKGGITVEINAKGEKVAVRKTTGWRMCIDFRKLNQATKKDHFPLPFIDQMLERLAGHQYYCFLDGLGGYYQIPIAPEDQSKTTFTFSSGTFAFRKMPFGLCNAPATFQRCVLSVFSDMVGEEIEVFMDDFSISGSNFEECLARLERVLLRCIDCNLTLSWEKVIIWCKMELY